MQARLDILGSSGGYPVLGLPCSGYRLSGKGQEILLDCGPGIATALFSASEVCRLDAVIISHMHPDHILDLIPLGYGLLNEWVCGGRTGRLPLRVPPGGRRFLEQFSGLFGHRDWRFGEEDRGPGHAALRDIMRKGEDWLLTVFDIEEYVPGDAWSQGDIRVTTAPADHSIVAAAMRLEAGGRALAYTGDTRWRPELAELFTGAALLLADAHLSSAKAPGGAHMTPREAGRLARIAGVETLVLCHLGSPTDGENARAAAAAEFGGDIRIAADERMFLL